MNIIKYDSDTRLITAELDADETALLSRGQVKGWSMTAVEDDTPPED